MGNTLLLELLADIREASWYSILADKTRDISNHEQLSITIRWVTNDYEVQEDLIGMVHVPSTTSNTLTSGYLNQVHPTSNKLLRSRLRRSIEHDGTSEWCGNTTGKGTTVGHQGTLLCPLFKLMLARCCK